MESLPMFPLGTVLMPGAPLQLQVFEPRYLTLLTDCLAGDGRFGVVLIERGSEVGGDDQRTDVGTLAQIIGTGDLGEGRTALLAVGTHRIRIVRWLHDDPYPRAEVVDWPDEPVADATRLTGLYTRCSAKLRELFERIDRNGYASAPAAFDAPDNPEPGSHLLAALTPVGSFDKQRLLCAADPAQRLELISQLIDEQRMLLEGDLGLS